MKIELQLINKTKEAVQALYSQTITSETITFQKTKKEFTGDFTLVVFPLIKISKKSPDITAAEIGAYLKENLEQVADFNVIKGFLNLTLELSFWTDFFQEIYNNKDFGFTKVSPTSSTILVEYSSPNTNKPLHLGHVRNNLLGFSVSEILKANGNNVIKVNLVNDRGIHICKSMLAWQKFGNNETPETSAMKGDHLVGKYYVLFDKHYKVQIEDLVSQGMGKEEAEKKAPLILEAQEMLRKWEAGDKDTISLWKKMNTWVYKGFEETYKIMGVDFDKMYYESQTYLLGKKLVEEGLKKEILFKKEDGSVWIDLTADGLDQKLLLRSDGTSVYMTQDLGTAVQRHEEYNFDKLIYVVGNEQDYHFKVLHLVLNKLGYSWANGLYHLSYGMVELPHGKMKSREGTVVDADDLINEMILTAKETTQALGKTADFTESDADILFKTIGLGALKYFILKVDPKKKMMFNPEESIDFNGNTGPFIQYTYARIQSVLRKDTNTKYQVSGIKYQDITLQGKETDIIKLMYDFPGAINEAAVNFSPATVANYIYELVKCYNQFYHEIPILKEENIELMQFRLALSKKTADIIQLSMKLLGIEVPERM